MKSETSYIYSNSKKNLLITWFIAIVLSLFSFLIITKGYNQTDSTGVLLVLSIIPLLSIFLTYGAIKLTIEQLRYGKTPLLMDPPIGSIGGHVGGSVFIKKKYPEDTHFKVTLTNVYTYTTRKPDRHHGGYTTTTHHEILWHDEGYAKLNNIDYYTQLDFLFDVPEKLKASSDSYYWKLEIEENNEKSKKCFNREFIIPAEKSTKKSKHIKHKSSQHLPNGAQAHNAFSLLPLRKENNTYFLHYPMFHFKLGIQGLGIFGGIFCSIGLGLLIFAEFGVSTLVGTVFIGVGLFFISFGLFDFLIELRITFDSEHIAVKKYLFKKLIKEISFQLEDGIKLDYRDLFRKPIKKDRLEPYAFIIARQGSKEIILSKYIASIKDQKIIMDFFKDTLLKIKK